MAEIRATGIGNLLSGFGQGIIQGRKLKQEQEESKLKARMIDAQMKMIELQREKIQSEIANNPKAIMEWMLGSGQPQQATQPQQTAPPPNGITETNVTGQPGLSQTGAPPPEGGGLKNRMTQLQERLPPGGSFSAGGFTIPGPPRASSNIQDQIARELATDKATGKFDPNMAMEIIQRMRTNPQGMDGRIGDYIIRRNQTGKVEPAMEQSIVDYQDYLRGTGAARTGGAEIGRLGVRSTPQFQQTERDVAEKRRLGSEAGEARSNLANLSQASAILDELDTLSSQLITADTPVQGAAQGVKLKAMAILPGTPAGLYEARKKNLAESLARNIGGVKGTATEGDIQRMVNGVPGLGDTKGSRDYKINALRTIINNAVENQRLLIEGRPIDLNKSRQEFRKNVDEFLKGTFQLRPETGKLPPNWEYVQ